jgi:hypothetical protein
MGSVEGEGIDPRVLAKLEELEAKIRKYDFLTAEVQEMKGLLQVLVSRTASTAEVQKKALTAASEAPTAQNSNSSSSLNPVKGPHSKAVAVPPPLQVPSFLGESPGSFPHTHTN